MKKLGLGLLLAGIVGCSVGSEPGGTAPAPQLGGPKPTAFTKTSGTKIASRHTVVFRGESVPADAAKKIASAGGKLLKALPEIGVALVEGPASFDDKIAKDPSVLASGAEVRVVAPRPQSFTLGDQIGYPNDLLYPAQWNIRRVNAPGAWQNLPAGALDNVRVAVLDTGIAYDHPEFDPGQVVEKISSNVCVDPGNPDRAGYPEYGAFAVIFPDGTGFCVPSGYISQTGKVYQSHGTHVAGIIGANANSQPYPTLFTGVAPGVKLASYKIMDYAIIVDENGVPQFATGAALSFSFFDAVVDATNKHFDVVNMSFGGNVDRKTRDGNAFYLAWDRVARYASKHGTLLVAAAGNDGMNLNGQLTSLPSDLPSVVAVGSTGTSTAFPDIYAYLGGAYGFPFPEINAAPGSDVRAFYSNTGAQVDVSAPGGDYGPAFDPANPRIEDVSFLHAILSPVLAPDGSPAFDAYIGTSMASPHVAGVAALVRAKYPTLTPAEMKDRLKATAQPAGSRQSFGAGIVDAAAATAQ